MKLKLILNMCRYMKINAYKRKTKFALGGNSFFGKQYAPYSTDANMGYYHQSVPKDSPAS
ncbi:MAG: hypothetical protein LHW64_06480 [Candidatus Cloacimonetes bacterium]|jgi:hypothetical protein|nr:hypothetical protein [Candidatus Cloacimonadota bacterium]MCB5287430.1 hypothetical protein [Candidatus Cloacimonadota bacterium]MCK9183929.1 hypothetical protein [Candidatus Cloacimonadota bacterium]MCK9584445.1 hypothetical protein [Candidatus Cloacimonadota bacterium]MDY0229751.1 hypothetical protein [Candidatus Cloacimonadaceae bacterium]